MMIHFFIFFLNDYSYDTPYPQHCTDKKNILKTFFRLKILQCSPYWCHHVELVAVKDEEGDNVIWNHCNIWHQHLIDPRYHTHLIHPRICQALITVSCQVGCKLHPCDVPTRLASKDQPQRKHCPIHRNRDCYSQPPASCCQTTCKCVPFVSQWVQAY